MIIDKIIKEKKLKTKKQNPIDKKREEEYIKLELKRRFDAKEKLKKHREKITKEYKNGKLIHYKDKNGEAWYDYNKKEELIHSKNTDGFEKWIKYEKQGYEVHHNNNGVENWFKFDKYNNMIHHKNNLGSEKWCKYNKKGKLIHYKDNHNYEYWYEYKNGKQTKELALIGKTYYLNDKELEEKP